MPSVSAWIFRTGCPKIARRRPRPMAAMPATRFVLPGEHFRRIFSAWCADNRSEKRTEKSITAVGANKTATRSAWE